MKLNNGRPNRTKLGINEHFDESYVRPTLIKLHGDKCSDCGKPPTLR